MAYQGDDPFIDSNGANKNNLAHMGLESDDAFSATPVITNASKVDSNASTTDPTFIQNQISIQRSSSIAISQASALSRKLSVKSSGSHEATGTPISGVLLDNGEERAGHGLGCGNSNAPLAEATTNCSLAKSTSASTNGSLKSVESAKSVRSVHAVGSYPLGSLRVHSPSPTRESTEVRHFLKSGDVVIIRDIPIGSLFGYDTRGFIIKGEDNFEGLKEIPPGAHFIWGGSSATSLRNGFWIMSNKATDELGEIYVKRWDKENEVLEEVSKQSQVRTISLQFPRNFLIRGSYFFPCVFRAIKCDTNALSRNSVQQRR
jgi:A1 cistron-splicing factor AAR2